MIRRALVPNVQVFLDHFQIRDPEPVWGMEEEIFRKFVNLEAFPAAPLHPVPKIFHFFKPQVIKQVPVCEINQKEGDPLLALKLFHKTDLVGMDIVQRESVLPAFLCIKGKRYALDYADIIHGAFLVEICQRDMPGFLVNGNRRDGRGDFLDQGQVLHCVTMVCMVY